MTTNFEKENKMVRVIMNFMGYEKPKVADVLRSLLSDYRRSFDAIKFERDLIVTNQGDFYTEVYIRESDVNRLNSLLGQKVG